MLRARSAENCKTGVLSYLTFLLPRDTPPPRARLTPQEQRGPAIGPFGTRQERRGRPAGSGSPALAPCPSLVSAQLPAARCGNSLPGCAAGPRSGAGNKGTRRRPPHPARGPARGDRRVPEAGPPAAAAGSAALPLSGTWRRRGAERGAGGGGGGGSSGGSTNSGAERRLQAVSTPFPSPPHPLRRCSPLPANGERADDK